MAHCICNSVSPLEHREGTETYLGGLLDGLGANATHVDGWLCGFEGGRRGCRLIGRAGKALVIAELSKPYKLLSECADYFSVPI